LACLVGAAFCSQLDELNLFRQFLNKFEKNYQDPKEYLHRFRIFKDNLKKIEELNRANDGAQYEITAFTDMTHQEFRSYPCGVDNLDNLEPRGIVVNVTKMDVKNIPYAPTDYDWATQGAVTGVKNQGSCGSCWAFSTVGNAEGVWKLAGHALTSLSEQELVDCSTTDYGCSGGWPYWALTDILKTPYNGQFDTETSYAYVAHNEQCKFSSSGVGSTFKSYKSYCTTSTQACSETDMVNTLLTYGPLSACLNADGMEYYSKGVQNPTGCSPNSIDHCITITGYGVDNGVSYWKIKNSWGTTWGEAGYYRLIRGTGACGINRVITVVSV